MASAAEQKDLEDDANVIESNVYVVRIIINCFKFGFLFLFLKFHFIQ